MKMFTMAAVLAASAMFAAPAMAMEFMIDYSSVSGSPLAAHFDVKTSNVLNSIGGYDILSVTGSVDGTALTALEMNSNQPNTVVSQDNQWYFDNVLFLGGQAFDSGGFVAGLTNTGSMNFWWDPYNGYELG